MARPLNYILKEIQRVAEVLDVNARILTRAQFLPETDVSKHDLEAYGGFTKLRLDAANTYGIESQLDQKEARGVELRNAHLRSVERNKASADYLSDKLLVGLGELFEQNPIEIPVSKQKFIKPKIKNRLLTLLWSDLHFGVDVDPREVFSSEFNWEIAARRMAKLCKQAALWKPEYRDETALQIVLNGDIIHGVVHLTEANIKEIQEQIWGATAILSHAIGFLSQHFHTINVLCLPGNHDRVTYRDKDSRAVSQRWNSHSHSVYLGLKIWFKDVENVTFDIPMAGMGVYEAPGNHLIFATHGDTEPATNNVGKNFDVSKTTQALLKLHAGNVFDKKVSVALFGHWHQPSMFMLQDGTICVVNGCLIGSDPYAQNGAGYFNSTPAQVMFESVPGFPVGDFRIIQLRDADKDTSLDSIIHIPNINKGGLIEF